jgi:hypothetical protein
MYTYVFHVQRLMSFPSARECADEHYQPRRYQVRSWRFLRFHSQGPISSSVSDGTPTTSQISSFLRNTGLRRSYRILTGRKAVVSRTGWGFFVKKGPSNFDSPNRIAAVSLIQQLLDVVNFGYGGQKLEKVGYFDMVLRPFFCCCVRLHNPGLGFRAE